MLFPRIPLIICVFAVSWMSSLMIAGVFRECSNVGFHLFITRDSSCIRSGSFRDLTVIPLAISRAALLTSSQYSVSCSGLGSRYFCLITARAA